MSALIIDGKAIARGLRREVKARVAELSALGVKPSLAVIIVGEDAASQSYVAAKERACRRVGMESRTIRLPEGSSQSALLAEIEKLNVDEKTHGMLVQLPLPGHIDPHEVVRRIDPLKDVDAFHPENLGLLMRDTPRFAPCTPSGILDILRSLDLCLEGKRAVIIGRSLIVGKPLAYLLLRENMTVTVCHSRTRELAGVVGEGDVVVAAVGKAGLVRGEWVKKGAIVVDVGTNLTPDGRFVGDVDFESARVRASHITPVPGGVGPLTVARLLHSVCTAASLGRGSRS